MNIFTEPWIKQTGWLQVRARSGPPSNWRRSGELCCSWCGRCVSTLSIFSLQPVLRWRVLPKTHLTLAGGRIMTAEWMEMQLNCRCWVVVSSDLSSVINNLKCTCRSLASPHANIQNSLIILYFFLPFALSQCVGGPRVAGGVPESPRLELMEQDSKDSAQSSITSSSSEIQPEYNVRSVRKCVCVESDVDWVYKHKIFSFFCPNCGKKYIPMKLFCVANDENE